MWPKRNSDSAMPSRIVVNGRALTREQPTGVDQLPALVAELTADRDDVVTARPGRPGRITTNLWEQLVLPWVSRRDVLLSLANSGPVLARRHVTMLHDMSPWDHPEWFGRGYRMKSAVVGRAWARQSPVILTPSAFSADRAVAVLDIEPSRCCVVGNAHRWGTDVPVRHPTEDPYVLTVSTLSTRKNLELLLDAWPHVVREQPGLRLRVAGAVGAPVLSGSGATREVEGVDYLGYVDEQTLDDLFLGARAVVSASRYEGFNIPLLDATVIGVPTAASDIAVHRELYGDASHFFDVDDPSDAATAIVRATRSTVSDAVVSDFRTHYDAPAVVERVIAAASRSLRAS